MYFFTADEHYGHENIIRYCERPFEDVYEMNRALIIRHNEIVKPGDTVIHAGDFTLSNKVFAYGIVEKLNGNHFFLNGSHDYWLKGRRDIAQIMDLTVDGIFLVICHYAMRTWARSHYNSWQLYGHSHGKLPPIGKQHDIGVDNNDFYPVSFELLKEIMAARPDNPNLVKR